MANPNCSQILSSYGDWLSNNPDAESFRPHPLFFSGANCSGSMWPRFEDVPVEEFLVAPPFAPDFGSLYIPSYWQVVLFSNGINSATRTFCSSFQPLLVADTKSLNFNCPFPLGSCQLPDCQSQSNPLPSGGHAKDDVRQISMASVVPLNLNPYTTECWSFDMCNSYITTNIGAQNLTSYAQGSLECDDRMNAFCATDTGYTCRQSTQAGNNLQLPECSCLVDEQTISEAFCQPGNTIVECQEAGAFQGFIPVTCFGKNCSVQGYRFGRMLNQQCNVTLCQQVIDVIGNDISIDAVSVLYCGTKPLAVTITPTPTATPGSSDPLPAWAWLLIGFFVLVFAIFPVLAIYIHKKSAQNEHEDALRFDVTKRTRKT